MKNLRNLTVEEKQRILGLHQKSIISERRIVNEATTAAQVQQMLKDKGFDLKVDGKIGPITLDVLGKALQGTQPQPQQGGTNQQGQGGETPQQGQPQTFNLVPGLIGVGILQDEAEGRTMVVNKVTPLNCGITEVEFKNGANMIYGYYKPSDLNDVAIQNREISFRRLGDGVKSPDACKQYDTNEFGGAGLLKFGLKPNEKPVIEQ